MYSALSTELKSQQKVREKGQHVMIFHRKVEIRIAVSCRFSLLLLSFLPPVRTPASQGPTNPSSAPPRCQNNLATLPHHTHTLRGGEFTPPSGRTTESRPLLPRWRQRTSTRQYNGSCTSRSTHVVVDMRSTVPWLPTTRTSACTSSLPLTCVSLPLPCALTNTSNEPSKCYK